MAAQPELPVDLAPRAPRHRHRPLGRDAARSGAGDEPGDQVLNAVPGYQVERPGPPDARRALLAALHAYLPARPGLGQIEPAARRGRKPARVVEVVRDDRDLSWCPRVCAPAADGVTRPRVAPSPRTVIPPILASRRY